jgi:hypothetical protein
MRDIVPWTDNGGGDFALQVPAALPNRRGPVLDFQVDGIDATFVKPDGARGSMQPLLITKLIVLMTIANGAPVLKRFMGYRLSQPIDGGL